MSDDTPPTMQARDLVLAVIDAASGRPDFGRTSLQKTTFFAAIALGVDLGHSAYYYGPYSAAVEQDTEALVMATLVEEDSSTIGVNNRGFPITRYQYKVSSDGKQRVQQLKGKYPTEVGVVDELVKQLVAVIGSLDQTTLAAAAKTYYIAREQGSPVTPDTVADLAKDYGWTLRADRVADAANVLNSLNLVEVQR